MDISMKLDNETFSSMEYDNASTGKLQVRVVCERGGRPIESAYVIIRSMDNPDMILLELFTDAIGSTSIIELPAPPFSCSMSPSCYLPYTEYNVQVSATGLKTVMVYGIQVFPDVTAILPIKMPTKDYCSDTITIVIEPHTLVKNYPTKEAEPEVKVDYESDKPVEIPEYIIVHNGVPSDHLAENICNNYKDYIKNVVSSEIYPTWPMDTIYAFVLATTSFTLNRIYTNWYPNQGYNFSITSSTEYDNKWMYGRNYYDTIDLAVNYVFNHYLSRPHIVQPILTQYCNGFFNNCYDRMEKWLAKALGEQGYSVIEILHYFYGDTLYINSTDQINGVPYPWSDGNLAIGSSGDRVLTMQRQLNVIAKVFTSIPSLIVNGDYDQETAEAIRIFQELFGLQVTGEIDYATWYRIAMLYERYIKGFLC
jgi:hypothetical protein